MNQLKQWIEEYVRPALQWAFYQEPIWWHQPPFFTAFLTVILITDGIGMFLFQLAALTAINIAMYGMSGGDE